MKTKVKLKNENTISQPMTKISWLYGYIDGYCRGADNRPYAMVVTEYGEFEMVPVYLLTAIQEEEMFT